MQFKQRGWDASGNAGVGAHGAAVIALPRDLGCLPPMVVVADADFWRRSISQMTDDEAFEALERFIGDK